MDWIDGSYLAVVNLAAGVLRALRRGLPAGLSMRLEADLPSAWRAKADPWIWLHAVSVGELILAEGVLRFLLEGGNRVHITTGTVAGLELLKKRLSSWSKDGGMVSGGAFPLDDSAGLRPFMDQPPMLFLALETEIWPNLLRELELRGVPRVIVNGRLTERSLGRGGPWMRKAASRLSLVVARDLPSVEAFRKLGAPKVALGGNLKADLPPPATLHEGWKMLRQAWNGSPVIVAGNTVEGEESLILETWRKVRQLHPGLKLILAPRQPKRFQEVAACIQGAGIPFFRASMTWPVDAGAWQGVDLLLLDTLGELSAAYGEGSLALVGGGWLWQGGHNPLEPVRWGLPTMIGPGFENFMDLVEPLYDAGLLQIVKKELLEESIVEKMKDISLRPGKTEKNINLPASLKGTLERSCNLIREFLPVKKQ